MKALRRHVFAWVGFSAMALSAYAEPYSLESSTLDSGGGTSSGGGFTLTGTLGQPDAGTLSGGNFILEGGFWPGVTAVTVPHGPTLVIEPLGELVRISWTPTPAGFVLESAPMLWGTPWTTVPGGAQSPVTLPTGPEPQFFRLRKL